MEHDDENVNEVVNEREEAYKKLLEFMTYASGEHFRAVAMETAKSNPAFFIKALEKNGYSLDKKPETKTNPLVLKGIDAADNFAVIFHHRDWGDAILRKYDVIEIAAHIKDTNKVAAIKKWREVTGAGLKEAKVYCDSFQDFLVNHGMYHTKGDESDLVKELVARKADIYF